MHKSIVTIAMNSVCNCKSLVVEFHGNRYIQISISNIKRVEDSYNFVRQFGFQIKFLLVKFVNDFRCWLMRKYSTDNCCDV